MALLTPTISELKEFYPTSASLTQERINDVSAYVKNHLFLKMFGFEVTEKIFKGEIQNGNSEKFIGFQKLYNLCVAYQQEKDPLMSTNFGSKIISRQNVTDPSNNQKSIILIDLEQTIAIHQRNALLYLGQKCNEKINNIGYFSYKISKI